MIALTLAGLLLSGVVLGGCMVGTCWLQARADAGRRQYVRGYDAGFLDGGRAARRRVADDYQRGYDARYTLAAGQHAWRDGQRRRQAQGLEK